MCLTPWSFRARTTISAPVISCCAFVKLIVPTLESKKKRPRRGLEYAATACDPSSGQGARGAANYYYKIPHSLSFQQFYYQIPTCFAALRQVANIDLLAINDYGICYGMENEIRKITVHVPADLLEAAQEETGQGVTETVRKGLELLKSARAYRGLREAQGKFKFDLPLKDIRYDRE